MGWLAVLLVAGPLEAQRVADRYDQTFRKYSKRYFGVGFDWRIFKAQGMTESRLDPNATSPVGARGVMQLMPSTFREIQSKNPEWASVDDVEWNIAAGIFYDRQLWRQWRDAVDDADHHRFMFGSYNAGRIPILTAQRLARERQLDPRGWGAIEQVAPEVPRWRHRETVDYVGRIGDNLDRLDAKGRVARARP
ncbi:MAG: transglycosylase SLT domain-containing protein [Gemmatimonadales bacterium]